MIRKRLNHEPPAVTTKLGWRYHHKGKEILIAPTEPSVGVRVAFILDDGAPVEVLQFYTAKAVDGARAKDMRRRR